MSTGDVAPGFAGKAGLVDGVTTSAVSAAVNFSTTAISSLRKIGYARIVGKNK